MLQKNRIVESGNLAKSLVRSSLFDRYSANVTSLNSYKTSLLPLTDFLSTLPAKYLVRQAKSAQP